MSAIWFDHFMTFTSATNIDDYLAEYVAQGFVTHEQTVRHPPGLRNGFISLGPDYLEFCWVEDETQFAASADHQVFRTGKRPFGIGMIAQDIQALHNDWLARGYVVPQITSRAPSDAPADSPPAWSFQEIPHDLLPGCLCFALTYHTRTRDERIEVRGGPNTIYALSGVTFVTGEAEIRAMRWRDLLAPEESLVTSESGFTIQIGPHLVTWMTPDACLTTYGQPWITSPHVYGDLALVHILATDLEQARIVLEHAGRRVIPHTTNGQEALLIKPDPRDGVTFLVLQQPIAIWLQERTARTGEQITYSSDAQLQ